MPTAQDVSNHRIDRSESVTFRRKPRQLSGVKRTSQLDRAAAANDAVDGAHSVASKCNNETALKRRWAIQGGEGTANSRI